MNQDKSMPFCTSQEALSRIMSVSSSSGLGCMRIDRRQQVEQSQDSVYGNGAKRKYTFARIIDA